MNQRIYELESQIKKDSHNSSKPPSSDGFKKKPKTKSLRKKSKKKPGSHKGHTLNLVEVPDETIVHSKSDCEHCHKALTEDDILSFERRQVFDIPEPRMQITEHQACTSKCPNCGAENLWLFSQR